MAWIAVAALQEYLGVVIIASFLTTSSFFVLSCLVAHTVFGEGGDGYVRATQRRCLFAKAASMLIIEIMSV